MNEGWADFVIQGLYGYYGWAERFQARRTGRGLVLNATVLESLTLTRTVRLRDGGLQVSTRLRNDGRTPVTCALGPSLHLRIPQPFTLRFDSQDGTQSLASEAIPDGLGNSVVFEGGRVPRGAWEVETGSVVVRHAFAGTLQRAVAGRVVAKGILALDLRTPAVALAPGETLTVEQAVSVRPLKA